MTGMPRRLREPSATEAIYIQTGTQVVSRSRVESEVSEAQFNQALGLLEARYEILRAAVWDGQFVLRPAGEALRAEWLTASEVEAVIDRLLDTRLALSERLYSVHVVAAGGGMDVFMLSSHAVTDAISLVELHSFLIHLCDCVMRGEAPEIVEQAFPESIDGMVEHCLARLAGDAAVSAMVEYDEGYLRLPLSGTGGVVRNRVHRLVIEPAEMAQVIASAHAHKVSLHSLLMAGFALAVREMAGSAAVNIAERILLRASVDLRRRVEPHLSVELVFSAVTAHLTVLEDLQRDIFQIAKSAFADLHPVVEDGRVFRDYEHYPKSFGDPHDDPVAVNISDMGPVLPHCGTGALVMAGFEYGAGLRRRFPNVSITVFGGRLVATMIYNEAAVARADVVRLGGLVVARLLGCAG